MTDKEINLFCPTGRQQWRKWLSENHSREKAVWLVYYKKTAKMPTLTWSEAVDEALCFGWIDSQAKPLDEERYMQFFTRRKPRSVWSKINKDKIQKLIGESRMTQAGLDVIEIAKTNGSWTILDDVEALIVPADLQQELANRPNAAVFFQSLCKSDKRHLLQWLVLAKRPATRQKRIDELIQFADQQLKPNILQQTKNRNHG